ncbi:hypothetical protein D3C87_1892470 [compost metagenome]
MQGRGGQEHVNAERFGDAQCFGRDVDVFIYATSQATDTAVFNLASDGLHGFEITR